MMSAYEKNDSRRAEGLEVEIPREGAAEMREEVSSAGNPPGIFSVTSEKMFAPLRGSYDVLAGVMVASVSRRPKLLSAEGPEALDGLLAKFEVGLEAGFGDLRGKMGLGMSARSLMSTSLGSANASAMPSSESSRIALSALGMTAPSRDMLTGPAGP